MLDFDFSTQNPAQPAIATQNRHEIPSDEIIMPLCHDIHVIMVIFRLEPVSMTFDVSQYCHLNFIHGFTFR